MSKIELLRRIAEERGTPCFVYFMDDVYARIASVREAFDDLFGLSYAMKCNPHPAVLKRLQSRVDTLDISSGGELATAVEMGWPTELISFTGPAKRTAELQAAVEHRIGEVILESVNEAKQLDEIAAAAGITQAVCVRIAPQNVPKGFGVKMSGKPCQFGVDEEDLDDALPRIKSLANLELVGLHIYSGTQCLKPAAIAENYENFVRIFRRSCETHDITPEKLIFGSGIGIPYHDKDEPVNLAPIAERIKPVLRKLKSEPRFAHTQLLLETGRYLIGEAGIYLTRVVNKKHSRGSDICVFDGGMNHHLGACGHLGMMLHRNYRMTKITADATGAEEQPYDLFGPLCTSIDTLGRGVKFRGLDTGDVIGVHCSGAYGVTASPLNFISHDPPSELIVETSDGDVMVRDITGQGR